MYGTVSRTSLLGIRCRLCWLRGRSRAQQDRPVAEEGVLWHALRHHVSRVVAGGDGQEDDVSQEVKRNSRYQLVFPVQVINLLRRLRLATWSFPVFRHTG